MHYYLALRYKGKGCGDVSRDLQTLQRIVESPESESLGTNHAPTSSPGGPTAQRASAALCRWRRVTAPAIWQLSVTQ